MNRRDTVLALLSLGIAPRAVFAQPAGKLPRVGILWPNKPPPPVHPNMARLLNSLKDLGWEDGRSLAIEYRLAGNDADRLARYAAELVRSNVDFITTSGDLSPRARQPEPAFLVQVPGRMQFVECPDGTRR